MAVRETYCAFVEMLTRHIHENKQTRITNYLLITTPTIKVNMCYTPKTKVNMCYTPTIKVNVLHANNKSEYVLHANNKSEYVTRQQ